MTRFRTALLAGLWLAAGPAAWADTLRLKSGDKLEGRIVSESDWYLKFDTGTARKTFRKMDIDEIQRSGPEEVNAKFYDGNSIYVDVTINDSQKATLQLDTGAAYVILTPKIAEKLGLELREVKKMVTIVADGREAKGYLVQLESLKVGEVEAARVDAIVMVDQVENPRARPSDGLLGMSFLSRYHLRVDYARKKLILES